MTKFTLDNMEHEEDDLTDDQKMLVHKVKLGDLRDALTARSNGKNT